MYNFLAALVKWDQVTGGLKVVFLDWLSDFKAALGLSLCRNAAKVNLPGPCSVRLRSTTAALRIQPIAAPAVQNPPQQTHKASSFAECRSTAHEFSQIRGRLEQHQIIWFTFRIKHSTLLRLGSLTFSPFCWCVYIKFAIARDFVVTAGTPRSPRSRKFKEKSWKNWINCLWVGQISSRTHHYGH